MKQCISCYKHTDDFGYHKIMCNDCIKKEYDREEIRAYKVSAAMIFKRLRLEGKLIRYNKKTWMVIK